MPSNVEKPETTVEPASCATGHRESADLARASPSNATTSQAVVSIAKFLGDGETQTSTVQDVVVSVEKLRLALIDASDRACRCMCKAPEEKAWSTSASASASHPGRDKSLESLYRSEVERLQQVDRKTSFERGKDEFEGLFRDFQGWSWGPRLPSREDLVFCFRLRLHDAVLRPDQPYALVQTLTTRCDWLSNPENLTQLRARLNSANQLTIPPNWHPANSVSL